MKQHREGGALDALIEEITVDAAGDDAKLWAFRQAFEEHIPVAGRSYGAFTVTGCAVGVLADSRRPRVRSPECCG